MLMIEKEQGYISVVLAFVFGLLFVGAVVFGFSVDTKRQDLQDNLDEKVDAAVQIAVKNAETAKDAEFVEKEKEPLRTYVGSETYGAFTFQYPKTWSVYAAESVSGNVLDLYAHPGAVPGLNSKKPYALRLQITSTTYDKEVSALDNAVKSETLKIQAFRPAKLNSVLGVKATGLISSETEGSIALLPLRDRTIKIFTESLEFIDDFNNYILPSITFVP